jgi:murein DD-endopeptidase MepM/ murein hydrolase activator NlpD
VRLFPATARQRLAAAAAAGALLLGVLTSPLGSPFAHADVKHLRHQQAHARHSVANAKADLDESSRQARRAYDALTRSRAKLKAARHDLQVARANAQAAHKRLQHVKKQLQRARARLDSAKAELVRGQQAVNDQHARLVRTVTSLYEEGNPQLIGFLSLMNAQTPADLTRKNEANNVVLTSQDQQLDSLQAAKVLLQVRERQLTRAKNLVARKRAEAHANLVLKRKYKAQAQAAKQRVATQVRHKKHAWALERRARAHDRAILARSRAREARVHRLLMAEIARERHHGGGYSGPTGGLLLRPVNGPITSPYGYRINPVMGYYGLHDGDDFGAACGTPIWAAGNGTVMSEYYSDVWGNRLFLNLGLINGKNVTVIYNHLSAYRSHVGERVSRGQVVGLIGTTGWSTGCHTHFTVMVNGVAVNPTPWLS